MKIKTSLVVAFTTVVALAGCGNGSGGGGEASGDGKLEPGGKIGVLLTTSASEAVVHWGDTVKTALKGIDWEAIVVDGKGDPAVYNSALTNMVAQDVAGIITIGVDAAPVAGGLNAADAADIPVVAVGVHIDPAGLDRFAAEYAPSDEELGKVTAQYMADKLPDGSEYVTLDATAIYGAHASVTGAEPVLEEAGFENVGTHDLDVANIADSVIKGSVNLLTANPEAKFLFSCCDFGPSLTAPALEQAGFPDVITAGRYDNLSTLDLIRSGAPVVVAAANTDTGVLTAIDQILNHVATGEDFDKKADEGKYEYTMVDKDNLPAKGKFVYEPKGQIDPFVAEWKSTYGL